MATSSTTCPLARGGGLAAEPAIWSTTSSAAGPSALILPSTLVSRSPRWGPIHPPRTLLRLVPTARQAFRRTGAIRSYCSILLIPLPAKRVCSSGIRYPLSRARQDISEPAQLAHSEGRDWQPPI